jgi:hypothetical protein
LLPLATQSLHFQELIISERGAPAEACGTDVNGACLAARVPLHELDLCATVTFVECTALVDEESAAFFPLLSGIE